MDRQTSPEPQRKPTARGRPIWEDDSITISCRACLQEFTMLKRRHHCRYCGKLFCEKCSSKTKQLPSYFEYDTPQRVCNKCYDILDENDKDNKQRTDDDTLTAQFHLRGSAYDFVSALPDVGSRKGKTYFMVKKDNHELLMTILSATNPVIALNTESKRTAFVNLLQTLQHPYLYPIQHIDFIKEKQKLLVFRAISSKGSLKDRIYKASGLKKSYDDKYRREAKGQPLPEKDIQKFGSQILQAVIFLKSLGFSYPHLHTGNIILEKDTASCSDFENYLLNYEPFYLPYFSQQEREKLTQNLEILCFGHVLFEMALGFPKGSRVLKDVKPQCPASIYSILELIFPEDECTSKTLEELLVHPFFSQYPKHPVSSDSLTKKMKTILELAREAYPRVVFPEKFKDQPVSATQQQKSPTEQRKASSTSPSTGSVRKKKTKKPEEGSSTAPPAPSAPAPPPAPSAPAPPPPPPPSSAPPPPPPANVPPMTSDRSALLSSIRNPNNMKNLKKTKQKA